MDAEARPELFELEEFVPQYLFGCLQVRSCRFLVAAFLTLKALEEGLLGDELLKVWLEKVIDGGMR